jgi:SAM-dependent methyltransferase
MNHDSSADTWDRLAPDYDSERRSDAVYEACVELATAAATDGVHTGLALDAGCGTGLTTSSLARRGVKVVALDYSLGSLKVLKQKIPSTLAVRADIHHLPFADGTFDVVLCANTMQHLSPGHSQRQAAAELHRVAGFSAAMAVSAHHYSRTKARAGWIKEGKPGGRDRIDYIYRFSRADFARLFPGMRIQAIGFYGLMRCPSLQVRTQLIAGRLLGRLAARLGYGHILLAVGRKPASRTEVR